MRFAVSDLRFTQLSSSWPLELHRFKFGIVVLVRHVTPANRLLRRACGAAGTKQNDARSAPL